MPRRRSPGPRCSDAKQYLYPSEFLKFVTSERVPLRWRREVTLGVYLYLRLGELRVLRWEDIDLEHGTIHVHRAVDRERGGEKSTKTGLARRLNIEPSLLPLLRAMHEETGGIGLVCSLPSMRDMARGLRRWLAHAGVKRAELHEATATRKAMTVHDLRATGITWLAIRGDVAPQAIMARAGHTDFATTLGYIREAESIRVGFGDVFPPLPAALHKPSKPRSQTHHTRSSSDAGSNPLVLGFQRRVIVQQLLGWTGLEGKGGPGIEGVSPECRGVPSAGETGKAADTPPIHDTLDRSLDQSISVEAALAKALAEAAAAGRYDVVLQLARRLDAQPVRAPSPVRAEDNLAVAVRLAAEASEWAVVATLSRQLDALRRDREGGGLKIIKGGSGASGSGER